MLLQKLLQIVKFIMLVIIKYVLFFSLFFIFLLLPFHFQLPVIVLSPFFLSTLPVFIAHFPYFENMKESLCNFRAICVSVYTLLLNL
jgi:hypothetical protein